MFSTTADEGATSNGYAMGSDNELALILREFMQFLESLRDVKLPVNLENTREDLLTKSKATLIAFGSRASSCSPEPYLDMNAGKGALVLSPKAGELEEYVGAEEKPNNQDYYETFQEFKEIIVTSAEDSDENMDALADIYANFSAAQTKNKCNKCGSLHKKERFLLFEPLRSCWVGLVGSHLLIYGSEKDNRPASVTCIRGYKSRHAPSIVPRNQKRGEAAFEIYRPGYETLQFVAKTPEEMEQWVLIICQLGSNKTEITSMTEVKPETKIFSEERYQDIGPVKSKENSPKSFQDSRKSSKDVKNGVEIAKIAEMCKKAAEIAPPLPARMLRQLPKLPDDTSETIAPEEDAAPSYEQMEVYDEDDIYHKIEDVRDNSYQNCMVGKKTNIKEQMNTYDDVAAVTENRTKLENVAEKNCKNVEHTTKAQTYDDINAITKLEENEINGIASYDEVKTVEDKKENAGKSKSSKPRHKKSFLDRVRKRRNLPVKVELKREEKPQESSEEQETEYHYPPPPRPIYILPPVLNNYSNVNEQYYDDIESCQKDLKSKEVEVEMTTNKIAGFEISGILKPTSTNVENRGISDFEHYQVPKSTPLRNSAPVQEELYDDIALLTDFKTRQRQSTSLESERRVWSRFGSGKKRIFDFSNSEIQKSSSFDSEESSGECTTRATTFQRLISKVEISLGKSTKISTTKLQSEVDKSGLEKNKCTK